MAETSYVIRKKTLKDREIELKELGDGWGEWKFQVNYFVLDGKDYGRPGLRTCRSQINYLKKEEAEKWFNLMSAE